MVTDDTDPIRLNKAILTLIVQPGFNNPMLILNYFIFTFYS